MQGKPVKEFSLPSTGGATFRLFSARRTRLVLYFHPRHNTPGCNVAGGGFPRRVSGVQARRLRGKQVRGIERSTFVLDRDGVLAREWRGVKVPGHVQEVLNFAKAL